MLCCPRCFSCAVYDRLAFPRYISDILNSSVLHTISLHGEDRLPPLALGVSYMTRWILALALIGTSGCRPGEDGTVQRPAPEVTVAHPVRMETADYADYTGTLAAFESVEIRARVQGFLEKINFTPSTRVEKGQLLFEIEQAPFVTRLDYANAQVSSRKADVALANAQLARREDLVDRGAITQEELEEARAQAAVAAAALEEADAAVEQAKIDLGYTQIHAPISGIIGRNLVDVGNLVGASEQTLLTSIVQIDQVYGYFEVSERDALEYLREGLDRERPRNGTQSYPVRIGLLDEQGFPHEGVIDYVDNTFSAQTGTIEVRGLFPNPQGILQPGMFVRVRIEGKKEERLLVKERAISADLAGKYVLIVGKDNIVETRHVNTGQIVGDMRVILPNVVEEQEPGAPEVKQPELTVNDLYIVTGIQKARPGLPVTPKEVSTPTPKSPAPENAEQPASDAPAEASETNNPGQ